MSEEFAPDTVVLVHGLWMTPRSWEAWVPYYEAKGYKVVTPPYPGFEIEVEALRENPDVIANQQVEAILEHHTAVIEALDKPPIIIGHSFGGTLTQLLLARGLGCAGVVIDSAPTEGVRVTPVSQARSLFPILRHPATRKAVAGFTADEFHYAFTNTLSKEDSDAVYERYYIPTSGHFVWEYGLFANFKPGHQETWVDYSNADRAPLLFIAGGADHIMPASVNKANAKKYEKSPAVTEFHEFPGRSHWTCAEPGWEEVADTALSWAVVHAVTHAVTKTESEAETVPETVGEATSPAKEPDGKKDEETVGNLGEGKGEDPSEGKGESLSESRSESPSEGKGESLSESKSESPGEGTSESSSEGTGQSSSD